MADRLHRFEVLICQLSFACGGVVSVRGGFLFSGFWDGLCYFILALSEPSMWLLHKGLRPPRV